MFNAIKREGYILSLTLKYKGSLKAKRWYFKNAKNAAKHGVAWSRIDRVAGEFTDALIEKTPEMSLEEKEDFLKEKFFTKKCFLFTNQTK